MLQSVLQDVTHCVTPLAWVPEGMVETNNRVMMERRSVAKRTMTRYLAGNVTPVVRVGKEVAE
jgi:hypothetical protein